MKTTIKPRGKNADEVKVVSGVPSQGSFVPLGFPVLSIHLLGERDEDKDQEYDHYCVTWSNYQHEKGENPGKFKIQRIEYKKPTVYVSNLKDKYGNKVVDVLWHRQNDHRAKPERTECWDKPPEAETLSKACDMLVKRFGTEQAHKILNLFISHELFAEHFVTPMAEAA